MGENIREDLVGLCLVWYGKINGGGIKRGQQPANPGLPEK